MVSQQNLLLATDSVNHGSAYYMLTGTEDIGWMFDQLKKNQFITEEQRKDYSGERDGYRLRYMMTGMKKPLNIKNDTEAICLLSEVANGALCAGVMWNGTALQSYAEWVPAGAFVIAAGGGKPIVGAKDQSKEWFMQGADGSVTVIADGTDAGFWSSFKIQPLENAEGYTDDYRFN